MSNTRLADARSTIASMEQAEAVFNRIATMEINLAVEAARAEKRIAAIKAKHDADTAQVRSEISAEKERLAQFILNFRLLFESPRCHATHYGTFGLRTVTDLQIDNADALLQAILDRGYEDCIKRTLAPVKSAVKERIEAGESFPGAAIRSGDTVVCKVTRELIDEAVNATSQSLGL